MRRLVSFSPPARVLAHLLLIVLSLAVLGPMLVVVGTAFKPENEMFSLRPWPLAPTLDNFRTILADSRFLLYLGNSIATTILRVSGQLAVAILAGYAFARWRFPGREPLFALVLGAMMIPHQLTVLPTYILMADLGWIDTWQGLIVPNLAAPLGVFLLRQHFLTFPRALYDAAEIDGAGSWRTLWQVVVPTMGPALAALTIVLFIETWNEYFWPLLMATSRDARTVQVGLRALLEEEYTNYGALMAGVTLASLPALVLFFALQRHVMQAFVTSGVKG
jgi:ABC-type glycerol-3-phosphate transport system permease component